MLIWQCANNLQTTNTVHWHIDESTHCHMINKVRIYTFRWIYLSVYSFLNGSFLLLQTDKA